MTSPQPVIFRTGRKHFTEEQIAELKQLVADLAVKRVLVRELQFANRVAERRAGRVLGFSRTTYRYRSRRDPRAQLRIRLRDLAASRVHYGYPRLWVLLRREGLLVNKKLVYRLYCEEGLGIRRRKPFRRKSVQVREARPPTGQTNESWSMDFMADHLVGGQRFRLLTLVDNHSRESLAIEVGQRLTGDDVVRVLERVTGHLRVLCLSPIQTLCKSTCQPR